MKHPQAAAMQATSSPRGLLFDLDGVLYVGKEISPGAIETVATLREQFTCRFITNTSTLSLVSLQRKINALGFDIAPEEIISAPQAVLRYLEQKPDPTCRLLLAEDVKRDFAHCRNPISRRALSLSAISAMRGLTPCSTRYLAT